MAERVAALDKAVKGLAARGEAQRLLLDTLIACLVTDGALDSDKWDGILHELAVKLEAGIDDTDPGSEAKRAIVTQFQSMIDAATNNPDP